MSGQMLDSAFVLPREWTDGSAPEERGARHEGVADADRTAGHATGCTRPPGHRPHRRRRLPPRARGGAGGRRRPSRSSSGAARPTWRSPRPATAGGSPSSPRSGDDPFGRYVRREAARLGVDPRYVSVVEGAGPPTPVTFCEVFPPGRLPALLLPLPDRPGPAADHRRPSARRDARRRRCSGRPSPASPRSPRAARTSRPGRRGLAARTPSSTSTTARCSGATPPRRASRSTGRSST